MATNINTRDDIIQNISKLSINEELFKALDKISGVCVKNIIRNYNKIINKADKIKVEKYTKLCDKYYKFCDNNLIENEPIKCNIENCKECFKKFILEDLILISKK